MATSLLQDRPRKGCCHWWRCLAYTLTCWAPNWLLRCLGQREAEVRQAWREKIALCLIIAVLCGIVAFLTFALGLVLCPQNRLTETISWRQLGSLRGQGLTVLRGGVYNATELGLLAGVPKEQLEDRDVSERFLPSFDSCLGLLDPPLIAPCQREGGCVLESQLGAALPMKQRLVYEYGEIGGNRTIFNGGVFDLSQPFRFNRLDGLVRSCRGRDCTLPLAAAGADGAWIGRCLNSRFRVGEVKQQTTGCLIFNVLVLLMLLVIGCLIIVKFVMAVAFSWFLSRQLDRMRSQERKPVAASFSTPTVPDIVLQAMEASLGPGRAATMAKADMSEDDPYVIVLVTCYSEGAEALRATLDSIAQTDYHDQRKLLMIIADGLVTGQGNWASTPELLLQMLRLHPLEAKQACRAYRAIGEGWRAANGARVVVGHYAHKGRLQPVCLVVKTGLEGQAEGEDEEQASGKPGNRGKRDSQLILMNFLSRSLLNGAMTPLDYELFNKIYWLMGVPADCFELCLMVDADTRIAPDSLGRMVAAMRRDPSVMGLCGETRIANKTQSWVTAIQVFEYYISHHLGKAFESVFGGVTCLPGCFCMYRIYSPRPDGRLVPILASPSVIEEYSQSQVNTLHKKNLLLLGEDRFLTTLMLKTFPKRRMIFVPTAWCKTTVPSSFRVLLSQRRRWINSTLHNLLELLLVRDLCGIFCFSMQFVIFLELIGTVILPAAIVFTGVLIVSAGVNPGNYLIPLALLAMVLGLPAILILLTTRRLIYVGWMLIYLVSLPVWNFILPLYAYWHFDDFSWGQTRPVQSTRSDSIRASSKCMTSPAEVPLRTWLSWTCHFINPSQ